MSNFYERLDEIMGDADSIDDIRAIVRRCWFYDFDGYPIYVWQGKGRLFTQDVNGNEQEWLGTIDANDRDHHIVPKIRDGRDGSSATLEFGLNIIDTPGLPAREAYDAIKADSSLTSGRLLTSYLVLIDIREDEGLRPQTPIVFFKEFEMIAPKFSERMQGGLNNTISRVYRTSVICKDGNSGRANIPAGTYADTIQKRRAAELGVSNDRGCEFLALLANRTYQLP